MSGFERNIGFSRQGIQLNPHVDNSDIFTGVSSPWDQTVAAVGCFERGPIGKPFAVSLGNYRKRIGDPKPVRQSRLNEASIYVGEGLQNGVQQIFLVRLASASSTNKYVVVAKHPTDQNKFEFSLSDSIPSSAFFLCIKDLECFNDGVIVKLWADENKVNGAAVATDIIRLSICYPNGDLRSEFYGSILPEAKDDFGNSIFLPDVVSLAKSPTIEVLVGGQVSEIATTSEIYGYSSATRLPNVKTSSLLKPFTEGARVFTQSEYEAACELLGNMPVTFGYVASLGTQSPGLLMALAKLTYRKNALMEYGIDGSLTPEQAVAFSEQLAMASATPQKGSISAKWCPVKTFDPSGVNGKGFYDTSMLHIAYECARNAQTDPKGFAKKNVPIAGRDYPLARQGATQVYNPESLELEALAKAGIVPVLFETHKSVQLFVFSDSIQQTNSITSKTALSAVASMTQDLDMRMVEICKGVQHKPLSLAIATVLRQAEDVLRYASDSAKWLVPSTQLNGASYALEVVKDGGRHDTFHLTFWSSPDGTARRGMITQVVAA